MRHTDPNVQHLFASMSTTFQYDTVILDHSTYIQSTTCDDEGILVTFTSLEGFQFACGAWTAVDEFILVTYTNGCGASFAQRTFWLSAGAGGLEFRNQTNSILVRIQREIAIEDALHGVDMVWGTYYPPSSSNNSGSQAGSSSGSGSAVGSNPGTGPGANGASTPSGSNTGLAGSAGAATSTSGVGSPSSGATSSSSTSPSTGTSNSNANATGKSVADAGAPCGLPPSPVIDGFPAYACGASDFDQHLDEVIGYLDFSSKDYDASLQEYMPGVTFDDEALQDDDAGLDARSLVVLRKRGFWSSFTSFAKRVASVAVNVATAPLQIAAAAVKAIPVVGDFIAQKTAIEPKVQGVADLKLGPNDNAQSPWGNAALLFSRSGSTQSTASDVALYCVNCGFKGHVVLAGSAKFNILDGLNALTVSTNANIEAGLNLGLVASATFSNTQKKSLINQAIPDLGVSVAGVFSAGCYVAVDAVAELNVAATGQALIGITMTIPNFQAQLNLIDQNAASSSSITGYTPQFSKRFEASGQISASAKLSLPVSLNVGLQIIPIKLSKSIALIEQPSLYGNVSFSASTDNGAPALSARQDSSDDDGNSASAVATATDNAPPTATGNPDSSDSTSTADPTGTSDGPSTSATTSATATSSADPSSASDSGTCNNGFSYFANAQNDVLLDFLGVKTFTLNHYESEPLLQGCKRLNSRSLDTRQSSDDSSGDTVIANDETDTFPSDASDNSDASNDEVDDEQASPDSAEFEDDAKQAMALASAASGEEGYNFTSIVEYHNAFMLAPDDNGNLYAVSSSADPYGYMFASYQGTFIGDEQERGFHYYPDVMAAYNVSRLRMSFEDEIPRTSDVIALSPQTSEDNVLLAVDSLGNGYGLVLCDFEGGADSKVFLVSDESGLDTLKVEKLRYTVTGGVVTGCEGIAMRAGGGTTSSSL
ncbi:MAG: hypothetical protein Q9162_000639 [Coniocarpon cinnabarinum]